MAKHNRIGQLGELLAKQFFESRQYDILHSNWRHRQWEIDIIASKEGVLHFIEVKTRSGPNAGNPEESVSKKKIKYLLNAADQYSYLNPGWKRIQFDVLAITLDGEEAIDYFLIEDVYE